MGWLWGFLSGWPAMPSQATVPAPGSPRSRRCTPRCGSSGPPSPCNRGAGRGHAPYLIKEILHELRYPNVVKMPVNKQHLLQMLKLRDRVVTVPCGLTPFLPDDTCEGANPFSTPRTRKWGEAEGGAAGPQPGGSQTPTRRRAAPPKRRVSPLRMCT